MKGARVLVTGGAGFIGSALCRRLLAEGAVVTVIDSFHRTGGAREDNLEGLALNLLRTELGDSGAVQGALKGVTTVFNLAGLSSHEDSMRDPFTDLEANLRAHIVLLEACRAQNVKPVVVYASTRQVYGRPVFTPVTEAHPTRPPDTNGIHKLACEAYHRLYDEVYGVPSVSLRLTNTYGPRMRLDHARYGVAPWFFGRALRAEELELQGGGTQIRDFLYVDDAVEAFLAAAKGLAGTGSALRAGAFNVAGERTSLKILAESIVAAAGKGRCVSTELPPGRKAIEVGDLSCSSAQFEAATGWKARVGLTEGVKRSVAFFS